MEVVPVILSAFGFVGLIAWTILRAVARHDAHGHLESSISDNETNKVRALLLARGHLLRREVRDAANVWLLERENEKKG